MVQLESPYSKQEINAAFVAEYEAVHTFFSEIKDDLFFTAPENVWSPAENLVHLIQSCKPVIMALNLPKLGLRARFGKVKHTLRPLADIRNSYVNVALAGGGVAGGSFLPQVKEESVAEKERILMKWGEQGVKLAQAITKWSDKELDLYLLPHPLLGKMSVREILFFTLYHNLHHVNDVQRLLSLEESEWFG